MRVAGAHALVTGGSKGIGAAIARELARRGAKVTPLARPSPQLSEIALELATSPLEVDLGIPESLEGAVGRAEAECGPVDILVNNAALHFPGAISEMTAEELRVQVTANLMAPLELVRQVLPGMLERRCGSIVNISSLVGELPVPNLAGYGPAKAGLSKYTWDLQRELRGTGLGAILVVLGFVPGTQLSDSALQDPRTASLAERFTNVMPSVTPEQVAGALATKLASDRTAATITLPRIGAPLIGLRQLPLRLVDPVFRAARS